MKTYYGILIATVLTVGCATQPATKEIITERQLGHIILEKVDVSNAPLSAVAERLSQIIVAPTNRVVKIDGAELVGHVSKEERAMGLSAEARVTINIAHVSVLKTLQLICDVAQASYVLESNSVHFVYNMSGIRL